MHTMLQFMRDDFYVRKFGSKEAAFLGSSDLRRFLANSFSERIQQKNDKRLIILSAHDTTITMILSALSLAQNEAPPFASTLIFELWKHQDKYLVKLLYNDKILDLTDYCYGSVKSQKESMCDFNTFQ